MDVDALERAKEIQQQRWWEAYLAALTGILSTIPAADSITVEKAARVISAVMTIADVSVRALAAKDK
jgi:hypothetical protein